MSVTVHGQYQGAVVIEDADGLGMVPLIYLAATRRKAENADSGTAVVGGRTFTRDALIFADKTWRLNGLVDLDSCWACVDGPATTLDHLDRPSCPAHDCLDDKD